MTSALTVLIATDHSKWSSLKLYFGKENGSIMLISQTGSFHISTYAVTVYEMIHFLLTYIFQFSFKLLSVLVRFPTLKQTLLAQSNTKVEICKFFLPTELRVFWTQDLAYSKGCILISFKDHYSLVELLIKGEDS